MYAALSAAAVCCQGVLAVIAGEDSGKERRRVSPPALLPIKPLTHCYFQRRDGEIRLFMLHLPTKATFCKKNCKICCMMRLKHVLQAGEYFEYHGT